MKKATGGTAKDLVIKVKISLWSVCLGRTVKKFPLRILSLDIFSRKYSFLPFFKSSIPEFMAYIFKIKFNSSSLENELIPVFLNEQSANHPQNGFLFMIFPVILRIILIGTYSEVSNKQTFFLRKFSACVRAYWILCIY